jgi:hypothetical protein
MFILNYFLISMKIILYFIFYWSRVTFLHINPIVLHVHLTYDAFQINWNFQWMKNTITSLWKNEMTFWEEDLFIWVVRNQTRDSRITISVGCFFFLKRTSSLNLTFKKLLVGSPSLVLQSFETCNFSFGKFFKFKNISVWFENRIWFHIHMNTPRLKFL